MPARLRPRLTFANVVSVLALFVALGGGALAAGGFVGGDGRIHACVGPKGGLTVIKPSRTCRDGKTPLAWKQRGSRGPRGPGAVQFEVTVESGASKTVATANGVTVIGDCDLVSPGTAAIKVVADAYSGLWWGVGSPPKDYRQPEYALDADGVHVDLIARDSAVDKWTHFQVAGSRGAGQCAFTGLVTRPSN
jgi:hypothetical protein